MALDTELEAAIKTVVKDLGQPAGVANQIVSWLDDLSEREVPSKDLDQALDLLLSAIELPEPGAKS